TVIENHIHYEFHPATMQFRRQVDVHVIRAIAGIYFVIISDRVPVVGILRHIVFLDRVKPQRGNAEVFDIVKLREYSRQIATMPSPWKGTVDAFLHALYDVVVRIPIDKAIGCNEIDDVALGQSGMATVARRTIL